MIPISRRLDVACIFPLTASQSSAMAFLALIITQASCQRGITAHGIIKLDIDNSYDCPETARRRITVNHARIGP